MWADLEASSPAGLSGLTLEAAEINPTLHMGVWCPSPMLPAHAHNPSVPQGDGPALPPYPTSAHPDLRTRILFYKKEGPLPSRWP